MEHTLRPTELSPPELRRLGFIRQVYELALAQSARVSHAANVAVLMFHDAIELFLQLAAQRCLEKIKDLRFMDYWQELKNPGVDLPYYNEMPKLNKARNNLKHSGV